jgi:site-specific recombinase XerD
MPVEAVQQKLGHASLATTTAYVTTQKGRRLRATHAFWSDIEARRTDPTSGAT